MAASQSPSLSVVMPVHNALPHLERAIRSIVEQSHRDFEFVILDNASTDGSAEVLREWAERDSRIRLFKTETNLGPAASSNRVVNHSSGEFVARMDADDISDHDRLRRQLRVLLENPEVGLVGSLCDIIAPDGSRIRDPEPWRLSRRSPFAPFPHGSIMYRRAIFDRIGGYRRQCEYWGAAAGPLAPSRHRRTEQKGHGGQQETQSLGASMREVSGVDLPVCSVMRTKNHEYPEYHTSLDDLDLVTPSGLQGGFEAVRKCLEALESNWTMRSTVLCEPQLGRRGLHPTLSTRETRFLVRDIKNVWAYCDGTRDTIAIAELLDLPPARVAEVQQQLLDRGVVEKID